MSDAPSLGSLGMEPYPLVWECKVVQADWETGRT